MTESCKPTRGVGWVFLFALARESGPFRRRYDLLRARWRTPPPCAAWLHSSDGRPFLVMETGIGAEQSRRAIAWALKHQPNMVVACGFAGALLPTLKVGDVLLASEVVEPIDDLRWRTAVPAELGDLPVGRLITVPKLVATADEKRTLARQTSAVAVDMESAAIAEACQEWRVPCAVVRAVSDTANTALSPRLLTLVSRGWVNPFRVMTAVVRSPKLVPELWRLARDTRIAARNLAEALHRLTR